MDYKFKNLKFQNKLIKLQIWDTPGVYSLRNGIRRYFKDAHGIILMYDVTDKKSFNNIRNWMEDIKINSNRKVRIVLVGNKCDSPFRKVSKEEGKKLANEFNIIFFEVSGKDGINVNAVFDYLVEDILNNNVDDQLKVKLKDKLEKRILKKSFKLSFHNKYFNLNLYNKFLKY